VYEAPHSDFAPDSMANHFKKSVNSLLLISECYNSRSSASIPAAVNATATRHDRTPRPHATNSTRTPTRRAKARYTAAHLPKSVTSRPSNIRDLRNWEIRDLHYSRIRNPIPFTSLPRQ
jgi:hypothetical protein